MPKQGDIYLVPIPFSDLSAVKKRPVLILSHDHYNQSHSDCLVMAITSRVDPQNPHGVIFSMRDVEGNLPKESQLRADKIYSVHQRILVKRFGSLSSEKHQAAVSLLHKLIEV
ncbi:MAG: type II toxin-antitoxin system PemK/MazF family toxin [Deltaproteobacteria bacterium]|nr:type II toxin-antitoxin system PemK/MazF family toxin [Deltaproteobacteria bacterium]MBI4373654.1 type II toxin-antitoxin system PemK/MazF family toxin [Deltaproteobacteria bacterium]